MSWLAESADGVTTLDRAYGLTPTVYAHFQELQRGVWNSAIDRALLEVMRLRMAKLIGCARELDHRSPEAIAAGLTEEKIAALAQWPTSPHYSAAERAVLSFCESYVIDAHSVTEEMCRVAEHLVSPEELSALTIAAAVFDAMARFRTALDA